MADKVPGIPSIDGSVPRAVAAVLRPMREILQLFTDPQNPVVRVQTLVNAGLANVDNAGALSPTAGEIDSTPPPTLSGLSAAGAIFNIILTWDALPAFQQAKVAYTEVWAAGTDDIGVASKIGVSHGAVYVDNVGANQDKFYWARHVSKADIPGNFNAIAGTAGHTGVDAGALIDLLAANPPEGADFNQLLYVQPTNITIDGVTVPAGVYMNAAYIRQLSVTNAMIANLAVDNAKIASLDAAKITTGYLDANRIEAESLDASKIDTRGLTIKDAAGNVILASGSPLDYLNYVANKPISLAQINSSEASKLASTAFGATKNNVTVGATAPDAPGEGDMWLDTSDTTDTSGGTPAGATFAAALGTAPADAATVTGTTTLTVTGTGIKAAQLLPGTGSTPVYGNFTVASDGTSASLAFNTAGLVDGVTSFRIVAYDQLVGAPGANAITVMASRSWNLSNGVTAGSTGGFFADLATAPDDGATLSGNVTMSITGIGIKNAELLPATGYTPIYGTFSVAPDGRSATLTINTATLANGTRGFRISAYDQPPGTPGAVEDVAMAARTWTISNSSGSGSTTPPTSAYPSISGPNAANFKTTPTFYDDFTGTTLSNRWNKGVFYDDTFPEASFRINNGKMEMVGQSDILSLSGDNTSYCSIDTDPARNTNGFAQKYGYFEVSAKLPAGQSYWPSFWLFNYVGDHRPEFDVFEAYPGGAYDWTTGTNPPRPSRADATVHPLDDPGGYGATKVSGNISNSGLDLSAAFHKYGVEWDQGFVKFYFDGALMMTVTNADTVAWFRSFQMYLLLSLGINFSTAGGPSSNTAITPRGFGSDPASVPSHVFQVDYVVAWQYTKY